MSIRYLQKITKFSKNKFSIQQNGIRLFSRRVNNSDESYKPVKPRRNKPQETSNLVWRDPNFELLASTDGFPLFLPGHIGIAWYDRQTTVKTHHELIMEHIDDKNSEDANIICRVQSCPTVLRKTVCDLFPYRTLENSELSVITITMKPDSQLMRKQKEMETERMAQTFVLAAKSVCDKLRSAGYWADFINPFSGRPYLEPTITNELYASDEKFRCLDFQIFDIKDCKIISNENGDYSKKQFVGSLFTNAPCKKHHLNSIFTKTANKELD